MTESLANNILGFEVFSGPKTELLILLDNLITTERISPYCIYCLNPHSYVQSTRDEQFKRSLQDSDLLLPDGVGILIGGSILSEHFHERITGMDLFRDTMLTLNSSNCASKRVFFLGSQENVLKNIEQRLRSEYNNIDAIGYYSPPFQNNFDETELFKIIDLISNFKPDVLWIGMTAPKQEKLCHELKNRLDPILIGCIGAVFDFYAGSVNRSPVLFEKLGLEWLFRLMRQPRRLWRRTFISAPIFLLKIFSQKFLKTSGK